MSRSFCCRSAVQTAPFASFSGRTEKEGPARPERGPISSSVVKASKKGRGNAEILRNCFFERSQSECFRCAAGIADATSFSLLDAKRTKQEKHAWGNVPHDPRARHFGSGQLSGTLKPVRRTFPNSAAHVASDTWEGSFFCSADQKNPLTSHAVRFCGRCLGLP